MILQLFRKIAKSYSIWLFYDFSKLSGTVAIHETILIMNNLKYNYVIFTTFSENDYTIPVKKIIL